MPVNDPWVILGIERDASFEEAQRAYRVRTQLLHPDRHAGGRPEVIAEAERSMKELNAAWEVLRPLFDSPPPAASSSPPPSPPRPDPEASPRPGKSQSRSRSSQPEPNRPWTEEEAFDWLLGTLLVMAENYGDPIDEHEVSYMLQPIKRARSARKLEQWMARRVPTLLAAIADDGIDDWQECAATLENSDAVMLLLLDRCMPD